MSFILAALAGMILGGGIAWVIMNQRWKAQVEEAETTLREVLQQHQQEQQASRDLKQKVADLEYQLNEANKNTRYLQSRLDSSSS